MPHISIVLDPDPSYLRSAGCIASPACGRKGLETLAWFSCAFGMQLKLQSHDWNFTVILNFCALLLLNSRDSQMDSRDGARCAANRYLKTRASVDYLHSTSSSQDAEHKLQDPRHKDIYFQKNSFFLRLITECCIADLLCRVLQQSTASMNSISSHCTLYFHISACMPCQLRSRVLAVHNSNVT